MTDDRPTVAAFDVDGTLTRRDCVVPFLRLVGGSVRSSARLARQPAVLGRHLARRERDLLKAHAARLAFAGQPVDRVESLATGFAARVAAGWLRDDTIALLRGHQHAGDTVVLVSASFEVYLRPLAELLGIEHVLATRLAVDGDRFTGALDGANCRGPEKVRRLHEWADRTTGGRGAVGVTAYGDSTGDRELLLDADRPVWMGRRAAPAWFPR